MRLLPRRPTTLLCRWSETRQRADGFYDLYCPRCERWTEGCCTTQPIRACGVQPPWPFLWGRILHNALFLVRITPARVSRWLGRNCGCPHKARRLDLHGTRLWFRAVSFFRRRGIYPPRHYLRGLLAAVRRLGSNRSPERSIRRFGK